MSTKREKIELGFKKAVGEVWQKIKEETVSFSDMVHLLSLCDNNTKLKVGYPKYATYCFSDCLLFARKFLTVEEKKEIEDSFKEKEYSFMSDSQKKFADHMRDPENEKAFFDLAQDAFDESRKRRAIKESEGETKH